MQATAGALHPAEARRFRVFGFGFRVRVSVFGLGFRFRAGVSGVSKGSVIVP